MYSLIVSPVASARLLIFDFSEFETRMYSRDVTSCARFGRGICIVLSVGSRGAALSKMRNHFSE